MRIGELAGLVGVSTRTIRHYHHVGVLPEPARAANGYRDYGLTDAVLLVRARRLIDLGLSLDDVADVLADDRGRDLDELLAEVDADLERRQAELREQRDRVAGLRTRLAGRSGSVADSVDDPGLVAYIDAVRNAGAVGSAATRDRELLSLIGGDDAAHVGGMLADIGRGPGAARAAEIYGRFDALAADRDPDPAVVAELADDILATIPPNLVTMARAGSGTADPSHLALIGDGLSAAQRAVLDAVMRRLTDPAANR